jgi:hypothetical protein
MARTPVLPEATRAGVLTAQLRRPRTQSATSAIRRLRPSVLETMPRRSKAVCSSYVPSTSLLRCRTSASESAKVVQGRGAIPCHCRGRRRRARIRVALSGPQARPQCRGTHVGDRCQTPGRAFGAVRLRRHEEAANGRGSCARPRSMRLGNAERAAPSPGGSPARRSRC